MDNYEYKLHNTISKEIKNFKNVNILEFGVRKGVSTKLFLNHANKNNCKVYSIDIGLFKNFNDQNWTFIKSKDDFLIM